MNKTKKKQKGYVLAIVMIITFVMAVTMASTFTILFRYLTYAKKNLGDLELAEPRIELPYTYEEADYNACF